MIFLDYIYYIFCSLYKLSKRERNLDGWRISGNIVGAGSLAFFIISIFAVIDKYYSHQFFNMFTWSIPFFVSIILFGVRYGKYLDYEAVVIRLKSLNRKKQTILNILLILYFLSIISFFIYIIFIKKN